MPSGRQGPHRGQSGPVGRAGSGETGCATSERCPPRAPVRRGTCLANPPETRRDNLAATGSRQPNPGLAHFSAGVVSLALLVWAVPGAYAAPNDVTDQDIRNGIETEFFYAPGVSFHDIKVFVGDGIATLTGTADHLLEKDRAVRIARVVKGVRSVVARIRVDLGTPRPQTMTPDPSVPGRERSTE